jgi:hypothetical protein
MCSNKKCPFQDSLAKSQFVEIIGKCVGCLKVFKEKKNLVCKKSRHKKEISQVEIRNRAQMIGDVCAAQVVEIQYLKRSLAAAQSELSDQKTKSLKPDREMANSHLKSVNAILKRRCEILANLYVKLSDFVDETGNSIGFGLFCHIDMAYFYLVCIYNIVADGCKHMRAPRSVVVTSYELGVIAFGRFELGGSLW